MSTYPTSYNNTGPFNAGPVDNTQLYYEIHNRILRHNLISVGRIIDANVTLGAAASGSTAIQYYDTNNFFSGSATGSVVILCGQTNPAQNGIYIYSAGATGSLTGSNGLTRAAALTGITSGPGGIGFVTLGSDYASTTGSAMNFLNFLFNPTGSSTSTGSTGSGTALAPMQVLTDQAGIAYPQGFIAASGSTVDSPNGTSNQNRIVYFTQEVMLSSTNTFENLGVLAISFSTVQKVLPLLPSSYTTAGTDRIGYHTSTMGDFFINARVTADLINQILLFRDGTTSDLTAGQQAYIANLKNEKLNDLKRKFASMLVDLYDVYRCFFQVQANYSVATGPLTPAEYNRGYNIYRQY